MASFRDPAGQLFFLENRILRIINESGKNDVKDVLANKKVKEFVDENKLVQTNILNLSQINEIKRNARIDTRILEVKNPLIVEHERINFPSYPYEWPAEMLHAAGSLTLDLAISLLDEGFGLKDATPFNILFQGPNPIFIDILSFEKREPCNFSWLPYGQFVRTFILPLLLYKYFGCSPAELFIIHRDGIEPKQIYHICSTIQKLRFPFLTMVSIPVWLTKIHDKYGNRIYRPQGASDSQKVKFILKSQFRSLQKTLHKIAPVKSPQSVWLDYMEGANNYSQEQLGEKEFFVTQILEQYATRSVLDVGCNTGYFSKVAARNGASVVAIDYDPAVVGKLWKQAICENLNILPLVVNLTRPSPAVGWKNEECMSFLNRAQSHFDMVLMLAVIHHMLVTERIPLSEIINLANEITTKYLIVEYIDPQDTMFKYITRGRDDLFTYFNKEYFEVECQRCFEIISQKQIEGSLRTLYFLRKKG